MTDQALNPPPAPSAGPAEAEAAPSAAVSATPAEAAPVTSAGAASVPAGPVPAGPRSAGPSRGAPPARPDAPAAAGRPSAAGGGGGRVGTMPAGGGFFAGRERELGELRGEIERPGLGAAGKAGAARARVLLVVGRPGVGRTAVALRLAREVGDAYPDGHFFVRLTAPGGDPVPVRRAARTLLRALDAKAVGTDAVEALRAATAGRRLLLVLDDVRHSDQLARLLPEAPGSLVVATSDGPLPGVPDVRPCTLGGLDTPAALELLAHTIGDTRVTNDPRAAESLVQEIAGHPTALRLVAAWLAAQPRLSVSDAAARLRATPATPFVRPPERAPAAAGDKPPASGKRSAVATDKPSADKAAASDTPRASAPAELTRAFRVVYEDLPATAARMLRLLVLAPAGAVDAQVASALAGCSVAAAQSTLDDFVGNALLSGGPEECYQVPGCLEPLLRGLVESTDRPEDVRLARARMLERTVRLLEACRAALEGEETPGDGLPRALRFASSPAAADWLRSRLPALKAAARAAVADGELDTLARRLIAALVRALVAFPGGGTMAAERYELHRLVLGVAERRGLHREKAAALINLADLDAEAGRGDQAIETYRRALDAARVCDDTEAEGRIMEALGSTYQERRDLARASDWFGRALALRQARGEFVQQARLHARIGSVLTYLGRYGPALREWRSAARVHRRLGDLASQARALTEAARVQEYAGHPEDALRSCRDALYWARQAGERRLEAAVLLRLADTLERLGDQGGARLQRAAARRLFRPGEFPDL
ncbi:MULTISPECIES: tetratricopeptide repeat protein [unclassified Streptomyces]|uniref:tetratricopeptide repeat protein n=1 Tax=unclassified Streptomyces TaxID=2593676 RepID=UPI0038635716